MNQLTPMSDQRPAPGAAQDGREHVYVTVYVEEQLFGIPIERVQDILIPEKIAHIPLAPPEVAGAINLRGRIVTVVDVRIRLGLPPRQGDGPRMCVTVEQGNELYSLMVDSVGEVKSLKVDRIESNPSTLNPRWRAIATGVVRLDGELMVVCEVDALLGFSL
ncbi:MAG: chemotaxis protein CheW [Alphaproteobacteria bacterium]|nr:chemotaxis protein CheW [Alphaproteobacteria bacterium]MBF0128484.1 chemotaxis protein CheW [Alphaproteobacteria bacterium]